MKVKENVNKITETVGTIQSRSVMIDGPTPNGTNSFTQDEVPSVQSGVKFMEGRTWATIPGVQVAQTVNQPTEQPREQQDADDVKGQA